MRDRRDRADVVGEAGVLERARVLGEAGFLERARIVGAATSSAGECRAHPHLGGHVAVLPEAEEVDVRIDENALRIDDIA